MSVPGELALYGGKPVRKTFLPYGRQTIDDDDIAAVLEVLKSDWLTTGPKIEEFEEALAQQVGARYAVAVSSGTAALHAAVFAAELGLGDEAITTPLTFAATANCLLYQQATPVFADICDDTLTINPDEIKLRITSRTKAVLPVDFAGHPAELDPIREIADAHKLLVIEDAAHAIGATYHNRKIGSLNELTTFSFHPVKHITTGEGGAVCTNNADLAKRLQIFRNHGITSEARERQNQGDWFYEMVALGFNYRLTDIGCALGLSQLRKLDKNLKRRSEIAACYTKAFGELCEIKVPQVAADVEPAWHLYQIRLNFNRLKVGREEIFRALRAENIGVNVHYIPVHLHPYYRDRFGYRPGEFPISESAYEGLISLPIFPAMSDRDVDDVIEAVAKTTRAFAKQ